MRVRSAWLLIPACAMAACGSGPSPHESAAETSGSTRQPVVVSVGHSPRSTDPPPPPGHVSGAIDLKRVVLRTGPSNIVARFTTYNRLHIAWMERPTACGQVGIYFSAQHLVLSSAAKPEIDHGDTAVGPDQVHVRFLNRHEIGLRVPRAALGEGFTASEPWNGYSLGYVCPPGGQQEDDTGLVTHGT